MFKVDKYAQTYREHARRLADRPDGAAQAVGGHFDEFGRVMQKILADFGLRDTNYLIDVGCGSGRLAHVLSVQRYLGTDVVPALIDNARSLCPSNQWRFEVVEEILIPERDGTADMVCFFSVFTHLLHEDSFRYLREARRVLKPGGKAVFSFLEFRAPNHWAVFADMIASRDARIEVPHNQFMDRDAIRMWAQQTGFSLDGWIDGEIHALGQSVCLLTAQ